jgi:hypothetical protein
MRGNRRIVVIASVLVALSTGCATHTRNVASPADVAAGQKVLAGRFVFYNNDEPWEPSDFRLFFNKQGSSRASILHPDDEGYIYVAVEPGQWNFATIDRPGFFGNFRFALDPLPTVKVHSVDAVVNFGTIEVRFYQSTGSKVAAVFTNLARAHIRVKSIGGHDKTRKGIEARLTGVSGPIRKRNVVFYRRQ